MFSPPRTPPELLHNLKTAFDLDLVSQDNFYSDDNLMAFSGASVVQRVENVAKIMVSIAPAGMAKPFHELGHPGVQYTIVKAISAAGKASVHAHLSFVENEQRGLSFENVEAIFGRDWADYPIIPRPATWTPGRPTHPMGNGRIRYQFSNGQISRQVIIQLFEDGSFLSCSISQETK